MIIIAKILLLSLVALVFGLVIARYRERKIGAIAFLLWLTLWIGAAFVIAFPDSTLVAARLLGIGRGVDLVLYISVILILYLMFRFYVRLEQMDRDITKIVRAVALREAGLGDSKGKLESPPRSIDPKA